MSYDSDEALVRRHAMDLAVDRWRNSSGTDYCVVQTAEAFLAFLLGEPASAQAETK